MKITAALSFILAFGVCHASTNEAYIPQVPLGPGAHPIITDDPYIVGGTNAALGEFPFQASLRFVSSRSHTCGGSVISNRYVLTAGHCVGNGALYVVVGTTTLNSGGTAYDVARQLRHASYDPNNNWRNDIALLETVQTIALGGNVAKAFLPSSDTLGGSYVSVSGWGKTSPNNNQLPNNLQKLTNWPVYGNSQCSSITGLNIYSGQICAGGRAGLGVCNGDSGGPLSSNGVVLGIASFVFTPCGAGYPDVFTRVYQYNNWILSNTRNVRDIEFR